MSPRQATHGPILALLFALLLPAVCAAQADYLLLLREAPKADAEQSVGLTADSSAEAVANQVKLQDYVNTAANWKYPLYLTQVGTEVTSLGGFYFDHRISLPQRAGMAIYGGGAGSAFGGTNLLNAHGTLCVDADPSTGRGVTFDGATKTLTSSGSGAVCIVTGYTVRSEDAGCSVRISGADTDILNETIVFDGSTNKLVNSGTDADGTNSIRDKAVVTGYTVSSLDVGRTVPISGGTNVTPGTYTIRAASTASNAWFFTAPWCTGNVTDGAGSYSSTIWRTIGSVDTGANTWTFTDNWCDGAVTGGTGYFCPDIVQDRGFGTRYDGIGLSGTLSSTAARGVCGIHVMPNTGGDLPTGKHLLNQTFIGREVVGVLCGRGMGGYGGLATDWTGRTDDHADHIAISNSFFDTSIGLLAVNRQSLSHDIRNTSFDVSDAAVRLEAGGRTLIDHCNVTGVNGRQCVLHLGPGIEIHNDHVDIRSPYNDAGNTRNPQLVTSDWEGIDRTIQVFIDGGHQTANDLSDTYPRDGVDDFPLIDASSLLAVVVTGTSYHAGNDISGWPAGSIRMMGGGTEVYRPWVTLSKLKISSTVTSPEQLLHADSQGGLGDGYLIIDKCMAWGLSANKFTDGVYDVKNQQWLAETVVEFTGGVAEDEDDDDERQSRAYTVPSDSTRPEP